MAYKDDTGGVRRMSEDGRTMRDAFAQLTLVQTQRNPSSVFLYLAMYSSLDFVKHSLSTMQLDDFWC